MVPPHPRTPQVSPSQQWQVPTADKRPCIANYLPVGAVFPDGGEGSPDTSYDQTSTEHSPYSVPLSQSTAVRSWADRKRNEMRTLWRHADATPPVYQGAELRQSLERQHATRRTNIRDLIQAPTAVAPGLEHMRLDELLSCKSFRRLRIHLATKPEQYRSARRQGMEALHHTGTQSAAPSAALVVDATLGLAAARKDGMQVESHRETTLQTASCRCTRCRSPLLPLLVHNRRPPSGLLCECSQ